MRLDRVLAAVTFDDVTRRAVEWVARDFAPEAELLLLHCVEVESAAEAGVEPVESVEARQQLEELASQLRSERVRIEFRAGDADRRIREVADEFDADIIALGAHRHRERMLGTTAERVLAGSRCPVLVVQNPKRRPSHVAVAVDRSDVAVPVLRWGHAIAHLLGARTDVLHVPELSYDAMVGVVSSDREGLRFEERERAQVLAWLQQVATDAGLGSEETSYHIRPGGAAHETLELARAIGADLIVMGSRGRGLIGRALLGSTASEVVRDAPCPVLVIPEQSAT